MQTRILSPFEPGKGLVFCKHQQPIVLPQSKVTFAAGGWRSTKTVGGLGFCANMIATNPGRPGAPATGIVVLPTSKILYEFRDLLFKKAFAHLITWEDRGQGVIYLRNDTRVVFLSGHVPERIEWYTAAWAYGDEIGLMKETVFGRLAARLSDMRCHNRKILFTGVPYNGWLRREFDGKDDAHRKILNLRTCDNPYLDDEYIENLRASVPKRLADCYLNGLFVAEGDVVWPEFDRRIHLIPWSYQRTMKDTKGYSHEIEVGLSMDWGSRKPHILFVAHIPAGIPMPGGWVTEREIAVVVDQIYPDGKHTGGVTVKRLCEAAKRRIAKNGKTYPIAWAVGDPAGKSVQSTSGESEIIQAARYLGVNILTKNGQRVKVGIQHVKHALEPLVGKPYLYFSRDLLEEADPKERSVLACMENYAYIAEHDGKLDEDPEHDDTYSHGADCVRYHTTYFYADDVLTGRIWDAA
jgi:hypothetical protein